MFCIDAWSRISERIRAFAAVATPYLSSEMGGQGNAPAGVVKTQLEGIHQSVKQFRETFNDVLPHDAMEVIDRFTTMFEKETNFQGTLTDHRFFYGLILMRFVAFESELTFVLSSTDAYVRTLSERAFAHLQRSIVVDSDLRRKWQAAFAQGEVQCERLGAVHMLLHGIYAFKVDATGARTDLILPEQPVESAATIRYAAGLVLTEWKVATSQQEADQRFGAARLQADLYRKGALAGIELRHFRYAVVVTRQAVAVPPDLLEGDVVYRHINVAVDPAVPSIEAGRRARSKTPAA